jgi:hypothetical protein
MKKNNTLFLSILVICLVTGKNLCLAQPYTHIWRGNANSAEWNDTNNWSPASIPNATTDAVLLDNSVVSGDYTVNLPSGTLDIGSITISPASGKNIMLVLPSSNTNASPNTNSSVLPALTINTLILHNGGIFKNSSGANSGTSMSIGSFLIINNGGRYIHNTQSRHVPIVEKLSATADTEQGIFEFDHPGTGNTSLTISLANRTFGALVLNKSSGTGISTYTASGNSPVTVRSKFEIKSNVVLSTVGFDGNTFNIKGNLANSGTWNTSTAQEIEFNGTSQQIISGNPMTFAGNIEINNSAGVLLNSSATINKTLTFTNGLLQTGSNLLTLGLTASISGEADGKYVVGLLKTTRNVGIGASSFGNIGISISADPVASDNIGDVTITRQTGTTAITTVDNNTSIARKWDISISNGSQPVNDRSITFTWLPADDNGKNMNTAQVWKQSTLTGPWQRVGNQQNIPMTNPRSITVTTTNFSKWTVSDENNPLPVDLLSLQAKYIRTFAELTWTTASERDNAGFQIQRSTDGIDFENIGNVDVTLQPKLINTYTFKDYHVTKDSYYRLRQIDTDGKFSDSKLVFVAVNNENELTLGILPNPTESEVSLELPNSSDIQVHLLSVTGQTLLEVSGRVQDAVDKLNKKLKTLSIGVYVIHVRQENKMYKGRLIKW